MIVSDTSSQNVLYVTLTLRGWRPFDRQEKMQVTGRIQTLHRKFRVELSFYKNSSMKPMFFPPPEMQDGLSSFNNKNIVISIIKLKHKLPGRKEDSTKTCSRSLNR